MYQKLSIAKKNTTSEKNEDIENEIVFHCYNNYLEYLGPDYNNTHKPYLGVLHLTHP